MISLKGVGKSYGSFTALRDVNLEIAAGELLAVVGKSGSGKSTLLNLVGGLDSSSAGTITIGGAAVHHMTEAQLSSWRGRKVGFVFQFFQLLPTLTAIENVMLPMDFARALPPGQRRPRALALLERMGIADQAGKLPSALSGGQQQRVAIARALANDPEILLADEPTGNLDSETAREILELVRGLGKTVIIATHERDLRADRTVVMADGRIVE